jgi:hypothetical protein
MNKSVKKVLRESIYLYSSPPKGKKIEIKYSDMKPLEKSNQTCSKGSVIGFVYNKKKNSVEQLNDRFNQKTQCRQSGCKWPRKNNICESYFNDNDKYFEFIIDGESYTNIKLFDEYFKTNIDKHEVAVNIKSLDDSEKNQLYKLLNKDDSKYANIRNIIMNNIWLKLSTEAASQYYLNMILSKLKNINGDLQTNIKKIYENEQSDMCYDKLFYNNMVGGSKIIKYKVTY